jgi:ribosomal-protein-alanine N-acetyltransferase
VTWRIRRAEVGDLDAIMEIESTTFVTDAWSREAMLAELANPNTYYLAAEEDGRMDGYAGLLAPNHAEQADIQTIAVVESARRNGLGRTVMNAMLSEARSRGAREVFLEVRADNPGARHLYEGLGFEQISVRKKYYQPDGVDAVVMRLVLGEPTVELA